MPCMSDYQQHDAREAESGRVLEFLKEVKGEPYDHDNPSYYGRVHTLDRDTAEFCGILKRLEGDSPEEIGKLSLELQLWWRKHKEADQARELRQVEIERKTRLRDAVLAKLTPEEREAILKGV